MYCAWQHPIVAHGTFGDNFYIPSIKTFIAKNGETNNKETKNKNKTHDNLLQTKLKTKSMSNTNAVEGQPGVEKLNENDDEKILQNNK